MTAKDEQYMYEINRLEGERDFWKRRATQFERALKITRKWLPEDRLQDLVILCRNVSGPCFCGAHTGTETMQG